VQDESTDFATYPTGTANANGALRVGVVKAGGVAAQGLGLYEGNNPWPIDGISISGAAGDLNTALGFLNVPASAYGTYTVKLGAQPDVPTIITLGGTAASDYYENIKHSSLLIEGTVSIKLEPVEVLWAANSNAVSYGPNVRVLPAFPVINPDSSKDLMVKFGGKAAGYTEYDVEEVTGTFNAVSVYLRTLVNPAVISGIDLGDYIDLPFLNVDAYGADSGTNNTPQAKGLINIAANSAINTNNSSLLRLIVVGKNSFKASGSYTTGGGAGSTDAHVVFQFHNMPGRRRMNPTRMNTGGYAVTELRRYLVDYNQSGTGGAFLAGLLDAGVPDAVLWGPECAMATKSGSAGTLTIIPDKVWLPTGWGAVFVVGAAASVVYKPPCR
jgi:hypothetical protein